MVKKLHTARIFSIINRKKFTNDLLFYTAKEKTMSNLKCIFVLFLFVGKTYTQVFSGSQLGTIIGFHRQCQSQTGISDATVFSMASGKFPDSPEFRRHVLCINQKMGIQDDEGNIDKEVISRIIRTAMPNADIEGVLQKCAVQRGSPEETAFEMIQCLFINLRSSMMG